MRQHIDVLGLLHTVWGVFGMLAGVSLAILATGTHAALAVAGTIGGAPRAAVWLMGVTAFAMVAFGLAWFVTGRRLQRRDARARQWAIALAIPNLLVIPFGTALGVYTFWVLLNNDARSAFGWPTRGTSA
ncbi:MAG: hypothetical protein WCQ64_13435 [Acidobacteriota bacterium]